jgi:orotate phosphoribosyltransferase
MSANDRWIDALRRTGALLCGHFLLSSGLHSPQYVQCALALENPQDAAAFGAGLAERLEGADVDRVVSPPLGALLVGYEVARCLERRFFFPERDSQGAFALRRGFTVRPGERVAVVEDVITTGRTTGELIDLVRRLGADVVALAAIVDRSSDHRVGDLEIASLAELAIPTYPPANCPLCRTGAPLVKPGSRREEKAT